MHIIFKLTLLVLIIGSVNGFGSNKPHLLFHLGQRQPISLNIGWGYWQNNENRYSKMRLPYQNTKQQLYVDMVSHNGQNHFEQILKDKRLELDSIIKYQSNKDWSLKQNTWFTYFSIENNDVGLIDHKGYSTPKTLAIKRVSDEQINIEYFIMGVQKPKIITIKSEDSINVYGLSANISQTYDLRIINAFQNLLQIRKYKDIPRANDSKLVKWENQQLRLIQQDQWEKKKFVFVFIYSQFNNKAQILITNQTQSTFNHDKFILTKQQLEQDYYKGHSDARFLRHVLFNLFGGIAYYEGRLLTQNSLIAHPHDYTYGFTPSRLIFPRSFLWDDGFHLSVAVGIKPKLVVQFLEGWMNKIDLLGWIGREQIRGFTMVSLMPDISFVFQDSFEMNPPTLFLPIEYLIRKGDDHGLRRALEKNFYKLQKWYNYFKRTQSHYNLMYEEQLNKTINYRWRCKDECKKGNFMGSGLDDYPRTQYPQQISKKHVDIICWLAYFANNLNTISVYLKLPSHVTHYYQQEFQHLNTTLHEHYLDPSDNLFKDVAVTAHSIYIEEYVTHIGYINLFPFMIGLISKQNDVLIDKVVSIMMNENLLLSQDGLRSLSISDPLYGTDDNYWRGPVWVNINYMVLRACKLFYWEKENVRKLYKTVRKRIIESVKRNYQETGYLYENYYLGKGNRGFPFYGWTSIINNIITQDY